MRRREYTWVHCCVCGIRRIHSHAWFNGGKWYCRTCLEKEEAAGRTSPPEVEYVINGVKVSKEEYEKHVSR